MKSQVRAQEWFEGARAVGIHAINLEVAEVPVAEEQVVGIRMQGQSLGQMGVP